MSHVMIDLETFGTRPGSVIRSIGAVVFDPRGKSPGKTFYRNIRLQTAIGAGLSLDADTILWWEEQSDEARKALRKDAHSLVEVVTTFNEWFQDQGGDCVWSHGANFDGPLWEAAARAVDYAVPWKFYKAFCTRTLFWARGFDTRSIPRGGTHHNALDDALYQVQCVQAAMKTGT